MQHRVVVRPGPVEERDGELAAGLGVGGEGAEREVVGVVGGDRDQAVVVGRVRVAVVLRQAGEPLGRERDRADVVADVRGEVLVERRSAARRSRAAGRGRRRRGRRRCGGSRAGRARASGARRRRAPVASRAASASIEVAVEVAVGAHARDAPAPGPRRACARPASGWTSLSRPVSEPAPRSAMSASFQSSRTSARARRAVLEPGVQQVPGAARGRRRGRRASRSSRTRAGRGARCRSRPDPTTLGWEPDPVALTGARPGVFRRLPASSSSGPFRRRPQCPRLPRRLPPGFVRARCRWTRSSTRFGGVASRRHLLDAGAGQPNSTTRSAADGWCGCSGASYCRRGTPISTRPSVTGGTRQRGLARVR